jgi:hypothetical protein
MIDKYLGASWQSNSNSKDVAWLSRKKDFEKG